MDVRQIRCKRDKNNSTHLWISCIRNSYTNCNQTVSYNIKSYFQTHSSLFFQHQSSLGKTWQFFIELTTGWQWNMKVNGMSPSPGDIKQHEDMVLVKGYSKFVTRTWKKKMNMGMAKKSRSSLSSTVLSLHTIFFPWGQTPHQLEKGKWDLDDNHHYMYCIIFYWCCWLHYCKSASMVSIKRAFIKDKIIKQQQSWYYQHDNQYYTNYFEKDYASLFA